MQLNFEELQLKQNILQSYQPYNEDFLVFLRQMNKIQNSQTEYNQCLILQKNLKEINQLFVDWLVNLNLINHPTTYMP